MATRIFFIHGLRTPNRALAETAEDLRVATGASVTARAWGSTGSAAQDLYRVLLDRSFGRYREAVTTSLREWLGAGAVWDRNVVVGHSWGSILARDAVGGLSDAEKGRLAALITLGSPATHPVFRLGMGSQFAPLWNRSYAVYRPNDFVAAFRGRGKAPGAGPLGGWRERRLPASEANGLTAHLAESYFGEVVSILQNFSGK